MDSFEEIKGLFKGCITPESLYQKMIELGSELPPMAEENKIEANIVKGCQSIVYLHAKLVDGCFLFTAHSDALISSGLARLLILAYEGRSPEFVLKNRPSFLEELGIISSLSPGRSNGVASMYLQMQKMAVNFLVPN